MVSPDHVHYNHDDGNRKYRVGYKEVFLGR